LRAWPLGAYFTLTFALAWLAWWFAAKLGFGAGESTAMGTVAFYLGVFAPGIVSILLTRAIHGPAGMRALFSRLVQWNVAGRWFAFALLFTVALKLSAAVAHRILLGEWPAFAPPPLALTVLIMLGGTLFSTMIGSQAGEELGWRGFALPRMAASMGLARAGVLLGLIWAAWHLPIFYLFPQGDTFQQSFPLYAMQVTAISVAMTWLYAHTRGSLFLAMLMHAAVNNTKDIVPSAPQEPGGVWSLHGSPVWWLSIGLVWACALWFLFRMPRAIPEVLSPEQTPTR
jgi:membrane protease YdiL (CAAX protease family)